MYAIFRFTMLLLIAGSAVGQLTDQQAVHAATVKGKAAVSAMKAVGQEVTSKVQAGLADVESSVSALGFTAGDFDATWESLCDAQAQLLVDAQTIGEQYLSALGATLDQLAQGDDGLYPASLYRGAGGAFDGFEARLAKRLAKVTAAMRKRMLGFAKVLETEAEFGLTCRIEPPVRAIEGVGNGFATLYAAASPGLTLTVDTILATSDLTVKDDGRVAISGCAIDGAGTVWVSMGTDLSFAADPKEADFDSETHRWKAEFEGLPEGNYVIRVLQGDPSLTEPCVYSAIGIR